MLVDAKLDGGRTFVLGVVDGVDRALLEQQLCIVGTDITVLRREEATIVAPDAFDGVVAECDEDGAL